MTNENTSPWTPHDQHLYRWRCGSTSSEGRVSLWKGQTALKVFPAAWSGMYEPTTATMSLAAFTCLVCSTGSDGTFAPAEDFFQKSEIRGGSLREVGGVQKS